MVWYLNSRGLLTRPHDTIACRGDKDVLQQRHWVSFETYGRCYREVIMWRLGYILLRRLGDVPLRHCRVFHLKLAWDVLEMFWWGVIVTFSGDVVTMFQYDVMKTYHWGVLVTFHRYVIECFPWSVPATSVGRTKRSYNNVTATSCCWVRCFIRKIESEWD